MLAPAFAPGSESVAGVALGDFRPVVTTADGELYLCSYVPEDSVPMALRIEVRRLVDAAAVALNLGEVRIRWFGPSPSKTEGDFFGIAPRRGERPAGHTSPEQPMTVAFDASLRGDLWPHLVAHEMRHVAQYRALAELSSSEWREADADRWSLEYLGGSR